MSLPASLDPADIARQVPRFAHYFRYPLHAGDFHALREQARLLGYYTAKPLYGRLDEAGRVDRSAGFNGEIAGLFVPSPARSFAHAWLFFARMPAEAVRNARGQRNWPAIRAAAEARLRALLR
ncbi:hypothetical protein [Luteimonas sp. e5]